VAARFDRLYKPTQHFGIEATVGMRDELPRDAEDAWITLESTIRELGKAR
jgi:hypothetical protein